VEVCRFYSSPKCKLAQKSLYGVRISGLFGRSEWCDNARVKNQSEKLAAIPRGNTSKGVNRKIIELLLTNKKAEAPSRLLDIPCGNGEFLDATHDCFPDWILTGADLDQPKESFSHSFIELDGAQPKTLEGQFDVVTCISGVMEFDNTLSFFKAIRRIISDDGDLIVTNDNLLTAKDRLLYLLSGRFTQYPFRSVSGIPTWKILPAQNLIRILGDAGFTVNTIEYVPVLSGDWLWIVVGFPLFVFELLASAVSTPDPLRQPVFQFRSFLSRHYVLTCCPTVNR